MAQVLDKLRQFLMYDARKVFDERRCAADGSVASMTWPRRWLA